MAGVRNEDIPMDFKFMADYWMFRKKFYIPEDNDSFWKKLHDEAVALGYKYDPELKDNLGKKCFYGEMIQACVNDIERRGKRNEQSRTQKGGEASSQEQCSSSAKDS